MQIVKSVVLNFFDKIDDIENKIAKNVDYDLIVKDLIASRDELQTNRIDAVTQTGRLRAVGKHMTQMGAATGTPHFGATHTVGIIEFKLQGLRVRRLEVTRPTTAGVEFAVGSEQHRPASHAVIEACCMVIPIFSAEGRLGG